MHPCARGTFSTHRSGWLGPKPCRQQKLFEEDNPDADLASSWLSQLGSTGTSATSGQSSAEEPVKRAETAKPKQAMGNKKISGPGTTLSTDGETDKLLDENQRSVISNITDTVDSALESAELKVS